MVFVTHGEDDAPVKQYKHVILYQYKHVILYII
jgi:hypothetical protein